MAIGDELDKSVGDTIDQQVRKRSKQEFPCAGLHSAPTAGTAWFGATALLGRDVEQWPERTLAGFARRNR